MSVVSYQRAVSAEAWSHPTSATLLDGFKGLHPSVIDLSLCRMQRLLHDLGNPERRLPPVIHVAGTNGKGSTIAFLKAIGEACNKRVHAYISPHLIHFHERILLSSGHGGARPIAERDLFDCLSQVAEANGGQAITFFESTTAAAFVAFARTPGDILLLETGMGGRLDATNVVERPALTVITPISIDHAEFLGDTLSAVAHEKAGIMKPGVPCVVGPQAPAAGAVIEQRAAELGVPLIRFGREFESFARDDRIIFRSDRLRLELPLPALRGEHQIVNAGVAIAAAEAAFSASWYSSALERGLRNVQWRARLERLGAGALHSCVSEGTEILVDGCHNPSGAAAVAESLRTQEDDRELHLIWGMVETKDARQVIAAFKGLPTHVYAVPIAGEAQGLPAETLAAIAAEEGLTATPARSVIHALLLSQAAMARPGRVLICGSLYLAGQALEAHRGH